MRTFDINPILDRFFRGLNLIRIVTVLSVLTWMRLPALAGQEGYFEFTSVDAGVEITAYTGPGGDVNIPKLLAGKQVTRIGRSAFADKSDILSLTIPNSVISIGDGAFGSCFGLTNISIPNSVEFIGFAAFFNCIGLNSLTIPNSVSSLGPDAFLSCNNLASVTLEDGTKHIVPLAFAHLPNLRNVVIPNSVVSIGSSAFSGCTGLTNLNIPNSVSSIGENAFGNCISLKSLAIPDGLILTGNGTFAGCSGLTSITMPNSLHAIGDYTFADCTGLTNVILPNNLISIGHHSFSGCIGLTGITIPGSVSSIGAALFYDCEKLASVQVDPQNASYRSVNGIVFNKALTELVIYPPGKTGDYTIPEGVTTVREWAFNGCRGLVNAGIPRGVSFMEKYAFSGCINLLNVNVDSLNLAYKSMGGVVYNKALSELVIYPSGKVGAYAVLNGTKSIGGGAFCRCPGLTSASIPKSVIAIGIGAFDECAGLRSLYFDGDAPEDLRFWSQNLFSGEFVTVYYHPDTLGWDSTQSALSLAVWPSRSNYYDWTVAAGLSSHFPGASGENDDPDIDGITNYDEWLAGTDPTQKTSALALELFPRRSDLAVSDLTPEDASQRALYFRSVPGRLYSLQTAALLSGPWEQRTTRRAALHTTQTRVLVSRQTGNEFYRVMELP